MVLFIAAEDTCAATAGLHVCHKSAWRVKQVHLAIRNMLAVQERDHRCMQLRAAEPAAIC